MRRSKTAPPPPESRGNFTPHAAAVPTGDTEPAGGGGNSSKLAVRNWRVATRLNAILLIPVIVALIFGGFRVQSSIETLTEAQDAEATAELVRAASAYGHALLDERDRTAAPLLRGERDAPEVSEARRATDAAKAAFDEAAEAAPRTAGLERRLNAIRDVEARLGPLREAAYSEELSGVETELGYVEVQHPLMNLSNELGLGTGNVTSYGRTVYAISLAKAAESLTRSIGTHLLVAPGPSKEDKQEQVVNLSSYAYLERIALTEYTNAGTEEDVKRLRSELAALQKQANENAAEARAAAEAADRPFVTPPPFEEMVTLIASGAEPEDLAKKGVTEEVWYQATTAKFDVYRGIEQDLANRAVAESQQIASDAKTEAVINSAIVLVALLLAFIVAGLMARSMSKSMIRLRTAAFDVAEQRLPMLVDQLSRTDPGRVDTQVKPIDIDTKDEIGEVARAFDQVHREAVRLAAEQALLRGNVNAIFTNLSSRNQGLIERQLGLITDLENNEADPDQLESLFKLDHLATRMRRNGENLLVLAGEEPGRRWNQPVPLVDVIRAASSEVEQYERIEITGVPESDIHGSVVTDLVHLLAELLENATSFSSPQTKVKVTATRLPDGRVMIEIHDKGIGLTAEDFADINHKLANPPTVDAAISQRMGLFVVGRLSDRHGIRVQLRPSGEQAGTTSLVMLPDAITHGGGGEELMEEDFTVSRIMPEATETTQATPSPLQGGATAAALGFDDSRYGGEVSVPDDLSALEPGGRAPHRDDHRSSPERPVAGGNAFDAPQDAFGGRDSHAAPAQPFAEQAGPAREYDTGGGYDAGQVYDAGQDYDTGQGYDAGGYDQYGQDAFAPGGYGSGYPQDVRQQGQGGPGHDGGYGDRAAFEEQSATGPSYEESGFEATAQIPQVQDGGQQRQSVFGVQEPRPGTPAAADERVGFEPPTGSAVGSVTEAGLPRREKRSKPSDGAGAVQQPPPRQDVPAPREEPESSDWRSANDDRWERAEGLRDPRAGGITSSGLPRRVAGANLIEGTAEQTDPGGPQVSRNPEDVRGRLSNLHRGVRRGRGSAPQNPQNERPGDNPGSTYEQER
ncbi:MULTISPECIES: sensor histidine kinase [unclassified Streptomyces]|uniref:sensor histidine kinase n=1 Tax=unclassified Streptomyces TaxID=2593676 RepID=UPI0022B6F5F3|nr:MULTISPECIES: nitrate- and nitrite sensing domain-containing protein [unclassified Streptomyces]MCZ7416326.1 nitrate- and nitrite sensing domain-containing protein [Streptomyces sp. WMMC897]MCZ7433864.1 nitrate- and nitrite sensing domain-containing protein [Streptomyces sp. WMMC1477]